MSRVLLCLVFIASINISYSKSSAPRTFPCVVMNHYTPHDFTECDTQCYSIKVLTHTGATPAKGVQSKILRTIRMGCAGKDDLIERARFLLEHKIALDPMECQPGASGILKQDGDYTLTQKCCTKAFCNSSSISSLILPLIFVFIAFLYQ